MEFFNQSFINLMIKESLKAFKIGEIPVGAIITKENRIISKSHNLKETLNNSMNHAEILAIQKACEKIKNWRLDKCDMYVSLEPCNMCLNYIIESRIKRLFIFYSSIYTMPTSLLFNLIYLKESKI